MKLKTLAALMPLADMRNKAWQETCDLTERHDVPNDDSVPADLRDRIGHFWKTANGYRIAGRMLPTDLLQGAPSSSLPLLLVGGVVFAIFGVFFASLNVVTAMLGQLLMVAYLVTVFQLFGFVMFLSSLAGGMAAVLTGFLPPLPYVGTLGTGFGVFLLALLPWLHARRLRRVRAYALARRGIENAHEDGGELTATHTAAREAQAEKAKADTTPFIQLGTAKGVFHSLMDGYAPDPGLPFGLTCADLSTHLVVFGATGTGKTSGVLRPLAKSYLDAAYGGALILDGKGQLAQEFHDYDPYLLVEPGKCDLALLEGLEPEEVVQAITGVQNIADGGENQFFVSSGRQMLLSAAVILHESKLAGVEHLLWSYSMLNKMLDALCNPEEAPSYLNYLEAYRPVTGLLKDAIHYYRSKVPQMDERTRSNILATCAAWLAPVLSHPKTLKWSELERGEDVTACLRGQVVGVNVPAVEYGEAGAIITSLVKARIFTAVRRRAANWASNGVDRPLLMLVDEAQAVIGKMELDIFPVARSLGLMGVYATQSADEFFGRFGEHQALALLNNFRSFVMFSSSALTTDWAMGRIGSTNTRVKTYKTSQADPGFAAQLAAGAPLFDRDHPDRPEMRQFTRDGVASPMDSVVSLLRLGGASAKLDLEYKTGFKEEQQPLLTQERADAYLAAPQHAVIQVMRGGVRRRDVVKLEPMFEMRAQ